MKTWLKFLIVTLVVGLPTLPLGPVLWPHTVMPSAGLLPFYIFLALVESLLFGFGVAFACFGYPLLRKLSRRKTVLPTFVSLVWLMVSWWPHDNLHAHIGMDLQKLLGIEYGFHLTIMIATFIIALYVWGVLTSGARERDSDVKRGGFDVWLLF